MVTMRPNGLRNSCCRPPSGVPGQALFPSGDDAPGAARRFALEVLAQDAPDLAESTCEDVRLIVSELVTNAYRYGTEPGDSVLVVVSVAAELVRVEVHDPRRKRPAYKPESDERGRGRGLFIVEALAADWGVDDRPFGKVVWSEVAR
ncbi:MULTISPECIES: ATP-binding protein [Streptomyces]|uniref:ATP-binding protein n=1 Tax=[Kitasatospora] papulosa TaxID=1464011 RepID=A0ABZ1K9E1_9ACTN